MQDGMGWVEEGERENFKKRTNFPKIMTYISPTLLFSIQTHLLHKKWPCDGPRTFKLKNGLVTGRGGLS